jgi:hypothetical protein
MEQTSVETAVADQIAGRKMKYVATEEEDKCGRRRGRRRLCTRKRSRNNVVIIALFAYLANSTCKRNKDLRDCIIERLIHCGSSQLRFKNFQLIVPFSF